MTMRNMKPEDKKAQHETAMRDRVALKLTGAINDGRLRRPVRLYKQKILGNNEVTKRKAMWICEFAENGWRGACEALRVNASTAWSWVTSDPAFRSMYYEARLARARVLESDLDAIARGEIECTMTRVNALGIILKGLDPHTYSRSALELTGKDGGAIAVTNGDVSRGAMLLNTYAKSVSDDTKQLTA